MQKKNSHDIPWRGSYLLVQSNHASCLLYFADSRFVPSPAAFFILRESLYYTYTPTLYIYNRREGERVPLKAHIYYSSVLRLCVCVPWSQEAEPITRQTQTSPSLIVLGKNDEPS